jgi:hypothetical protein
MLGNYPDTHKHIRSVVSFSGVVYGTPLAKKRSIVVETLLRYLPLPGFGFGDGHAIKDLSYPVRKLWMESHPLPQSIRYASVVAIPSEDRVSNVLKPSWLKLNTIDRNNDSQMIARDALLPGSELLAVVNADHWAIALPFHERAPWLTRWLIDKNKFPRQALLRAIIDYLESSEQEE